jgi:anaerobic selenocysteine-containing dehydrogenase
MLPDHVHESRSNASEYRGLPASMENTFLVAVDAFHPTETTKFADVVLPAALKKKGSQATRNGGTTSIQSLSIRLARPRVIWPFSSTWRTASATAI